MTTPGGQTPIDQLIAGLHWESHGPQDGVPLILSAGLGGSGRYWLPNVPALVEAGYRVILYDHRGTGRSDRALPDVVTVDDLADDMLALMDGLGLPSAHIMGHAAGGVAGLALALKAPERIDRLVVVNGWARPDPHFARCFDARLAILHGAGAEAYLKAQPIFLFPATWISQHHEQLEEETRHHLAHFPGAATMEKRIAALRAFDIGYRLGDIGVPLLALAAKDDMLVPYTASHFVKEVPGAVQALMNWGGHACNLTDPQAFTRLVSDFLRS
ncbi:pyrimidine utilization protein D [Sphingobium aquiterrae]|uniref:pyrimidine utilization protein D n=1 Tax=Sphingobium aquiterrae TaxID=2038656 RepID=UPI0030171BE2